MAAVKKTQTENKAATVAPATVAPGMVTVTVGAGPIHHGGRRYAPGDTLQVTEEVATALAKLVTRTAK
jgi:hypothetical protein